MSLSSSVDDQMAVGGNEKWNGSYEDVESSAAASETTGFLNGNEPLQKQRRLWSFQNLRIVLEVALLSTLIALFASGSVHVSHKSTKSPQYGPIVPRKDVLLGNTAGFGPDLVYNNHEMLWNATEMKHIHRNWQQLFNKGRGYVFVKENEDFEVLHPPFVMTDVLEKGDHYEGYILANANQRDLQSILTTSMGTSREEWRAMDPKIVEHRSHCVEYLRQSILCNGDTTLEGETGSWTTSTGWGQTHSCVDFDALTEMANGRAIWDLTQELLPESFNFTTANTAGAPAHESHKKLGGD
ncbi:hypothetical protein MBLNU459_g2254t2 [Dothideomycetes sp. NU459]